MTTKPFWVEAMYPFVIEAKDDVDAYRQVRDIVENELHGTAAEDWPLQVSVRPISEVEESPSLRAALGGEAT